MTKSMDYYLMASFMVILDQLGVYIPAIVKISDHTLQKIKYVSELLQNPLVKKNGIVKFRFDSTTVILPANYEKELEILLEARKNATELAPSIMTPHLVEINQCLEYSISKSYIKVNTEGQISIEFTAYCSLAFSEDALFSLSEELKIETFLKLFDDRK